ncbi:DnaB-like helicase C-terminal domain-containing protein [Streptomyces sp900129855]|uniref:DnaB-like helicase C-terminal domain-containing protein n=1 Tax=Streptomyces sp. 900129855 TaxID=3155129 RepID=A0ABV3A036_9ACTN
MATAGDVQQDAAGDVEAGIGVQADEFVTLGLGQRRHAVGERLGLGLRVVDLRLPDQVAFQPGDAGGDVPAGGPTFGLPGLDAATGGLQRGKLTLVAARPSVGGSLLGLAAARKTALVDHSLVLYAASGPNRDDIFRRIIAAETGGEYARLKQGRLTEHEQQVARQLVQAGDVLLIDDGTDLRAEDIAETAPHMEGLALVVVDRLQAAMISAKTPTDGSSPAPRTPSKSGSSAHRGSAPQAGDRRAGGLHGAGAQPHAPAVLDVGHEAEYPHLGTTSEGQPVAWVGSAPDDD